MSLISIASPELKNIVLGEVEKARLPEPVSSDIKCYPGINQDVDSMYFVRILCGTSRENFLVSGSYAHLEFMYNPTKYTIDNVNIGTGGRLSGKGVARRLVHIMENVGVLVDCKIIEITDNRAPLFWKNLGYIEIDEDYWIKIPAYKAFQ